MIINTRLLFFTGFIYMLGINLPGPAAHQFSLSIGTPEPTLKIGSMVPIRTTLTNISDYKRRLRCVLGNVWQQLTLGAVGNAFVQ